MYTVIVALYNYHTFIQFYNNYNSMTSSQSNQQNFTGLFASVSPRLQQSFSSNRQKGFTQSHAFQSLIKSNNWNHNYNHNDHLHQINQKQPINNMLSSLNYRPSDINSKLQSQHSHKPPINIRYLSRHISDPNNSNFKGVNPQQSGITNRSGSSSEKQYQQCLICNPKYTNIPKSTPPIKFTYSLNKQEKIVMPNFVQQHESQQQHQSQQQQEHQQQHQQKQSSKISDKNLKIERTESIKVNYQSAVDQHYECKAKMQLLEIRHDSVLTEVIQKIKSIFVKLTMTNKNIQSINLEANLNQHQLKPTSKHKNSQQQIQSQNSSSSIKNSDHVEDVSDSEEELLVANQQIIYHKLSQINSVIDKVQKQQEKLNKKYQLNQQQICRQLSVKNTKIQQLTTKVSQMKKQNILLLSTVDKLQEQLSEQRKKKKVQDKHPKLLDSIQQQSPIVLDFQNFHGQQDYEQLISELHKILKTKQKTIQGLKKQIIKLQTKITQIQDNYISQKQLEVLHNTIQEHENQLLTEGGTLFDKINNKTYNYFNGKVFQNQLLYELKKDNKKLLQFFIRNNKNLAFIGSQDQYFTNKIGRRLQSTTLKQQNRPNLICFQAVQKIHDTICDLGKKIQRISCNAMNNNNAQTNHKISNPHHQNDRHKQTKKTQKNDNNVDEKLYDNFIEQMKICELHVSQLLNYTGKLLHSTKDKYNVRKQDKLHDNKQPTQRRSKANQNQHDKAQQQAMKLNNQISGLQEQIRILQLRVEEQEHERVKLETGTNLQIQKYRQTISKLNLDYLQLQFRLNKEQAIVRQLKNSKQQLSNQLELEVKKQQLLKKQEIKSTNKKSSMTAISHNYIDTTVSLLSDEVDSLRFNNDQLTVRNQSFIKKLEQANKRIYQLQDQLVESKYKCNHHLKMVNISLQH